MHRGDRAGTNDEALTRASAAEQEGAGVMLLRSQGGAAIVSAAIVVLVAGAVVTGCGDDDCSVSSTCASASSGAPGGGDGGSSGNVDPVTGDPADGSFVFEAIGPQPRITHDASLKVKLTLRRGKAQADDVVVTLANLPAGVTVDPLTIKGSETTGELVVKVAASAKQGPFEATVQGKAPKAEATTALPLFVRGKPGTVDTTFGTDGRKLAAVGAGASPPVELLVDKSDRVYVVAECGAATCAARLTPDGAADASYGGGSAV